MVPTRNSQKKETDLEIRKEKILARESVNKTTLVRERVSMRCKIGKQEAGK